MPTGSSKNIRRHMQILVLLVTSTSNIVTFTNASATMVDGKLVDAWNARNNVIDLVQDGHKLLASTIEDSFISVSYVGNGRT